METENASPQENLQKDSKNNQIKKEIIATQVHNST